MPKAQFIFFIEFLFSIYWLSRIFFILPAFAPDTNEPKKEKKKKKIWSSKNYLTFEKVKFYFKNSKIFKLF